MNKNTVKRYAFWIAFTELVGLIAGLITREATKLYAESITKPPLSPPAILFPIVWAVLYALMGVSAARLQLSFERERRGKELYLYLAQLCFNFFWSIIFFNFQAFGFAFAWIIALWILILLMILSFAKKDRTAALLQIPYLVWVTFAAYLNFGVWLLNK